MVFGRPHGARGRASRRIVRARLRTRMKQVGWRIALITTVPPVAAALVPTLRELGHDPVAMHQRAPRQPAPPGREPMGDETGSEGLDVLLAHDKWSVEPLLRASAPTWRCAGASRGASRRPRSTCRRSAR